MFCESLNTKRKGFRRNKKSTIHRFLCLKCRKSFSFKNNKSIDTTRRHLEDGSSYRTIQRRGGCSRNTAFKHVHRIGKEAKESLWIAMNLKPKWSKILCFDGTYIAVKNLFAKLIRQKKWLLEDERFLHKMVALLGVDYHTRDLPHYSLGDNENMIDYEQLTMYLQYEKGLVPTTSNVAENMNKQLKARLKSMCSFQTINSAQDYLKLWCLKRRFQKFTDCKKPHQHLNGKAPLQLAGCDISKLDYLKL